MTFFIGNFWKLLMPFSHDKPLLRLLAARVQERGNGMVSAFFQSRKQLVTLCDNCYKRLRCGLLTSLSLACQRACVTYVADADPLLTCGFSVKIQVCKIPAQVELEILCAYHWIWAVHSLYSSEITLQDIGQQRNRKNVCSLHPATDVTVCFKALMSS